MKRQKTPASSRRARASNGPARGRGKPFDGSRPGPGRPALTAEHRLRQRAERLALRDAREEIRVGMALAQSYALEVLQALRAIVLDPAVDPKDRKAAADTLLERAYGEPGQAAEAFAGMSPSQAPGITFNALALPREAVDAIVDRAVALLPRP